DYADLSPGVNNLVISAVDTFGEQTDHAVTIDYTDGVTWVLPYTAAFSTANEVTDVAHVIDGRWHLTDSGVRTDSSAAGYDRFLVLGDRTWSPDYEITVPLTVNQVNLGGSTSVGLAIGWQGHDGPDRPRLFKRYQALTRLTDLSTNPTLILKDTNVTRAQKSITFQSGTQYRLKVRSLSLGAGLAQVDVKFWEDGMPEPTEYDLTYDFPRHEGSIILMAKYGDITFGDAEVVPLFPIVHSVTATTVGNGSINLNPDYELYPDSAVVELNAVPDPGYAFLGWSGGLTGQVNPDTITLINDTTVTATFVEGIQSDDFYGPTLDTSLWRVIDPLGDATMTMTGTNLTVYIPGGTKHSLSSSGITAPRIMQDSPDTDFEVEVAFGGKGRHGYQGQGIIIQEDEDTYLRFDFVYTNTGTQVFVGYFDAGTLTTKYQVTASDDPSHLKIRRVGDRWTFRRSSDGATWTAPRNFEQSMTVTEIGVFFSNSGGLWDMPAFVGNVDYFFNTSNPIVPEDDGSPTAVTPPVVDMWYGDTLSFGDLGVPQRWVNLVGNVWDSDSIATLSYTLNGGPSLDLTMGPDGKRLIGVGDFNAEIDYSSLIAGSNTIVITAIDELGEQTDHTVTLNYTPGITWQMPYSADFTTATAVT
ncbi:MAG: DUF1349 domain-containing protein, partial [Candidatus Latescibacterota bacterium]